MARPDAYVLQCAFGSSPEDAIRDQVWTDLTEYLDVQTGVKITRGRTDEYSQVQPSTMALTLDNRDGRFTPENTASPYFPNVVSGKRIRLGLMRKGNGKQIYDADPSFEGTASFGWESKPGFPTTTIASTSSFAQAGSKSMQLTLPTAAAGQVIVRRFVYGLIPGRQYTASAYVRQPSGGTTVAFGCTPGGAQAIVTTNAFQRRSVTFTAVDPFCELYVYTLTSSTAGQLIQVDAVQVEEGATATTFEPTGASFTWRFTGDVNEWPLNWVGGPAAYAESRITATDRLKRLGDLGEFQTFLKEDVLDDHPVAYYPLDDPATSLTAGDISGNNQPPMMQVQVGQLGTITFGWDHTDTLNDYAVPDFYRGTTGVQFQPYQVGTPITASYPQGKYLRGTLNTPITTNNGASVVCYAQFPSSGKSDFGPLAFLTASDGSYLGIHQSVFGGMTAIFINQNDGQGGYPWEVTVPTNSGYDINYQFAAVLSIPSAGNGLLTFIRGGSVIGTAGPFAMSQQPKWIQTAVGGRDKQVDGVARANISHAQFYDYALATGVLAGQWYVAYQGRSTAASVDTTLKRMQRLLGFRGLWKSDGSVLLGVGGTDPSLIGPQEITGNPIDAIRLVEATEDGVFYLNGAGQASFLYRSYRFNAATTLTLPVDRVDPGSITFRGDDFGLVNDVTASRPDGASARVQNAASIDANGSRKATITAIPQSDGDLEVLAAWEANTFGTQRNRITGVKLSLLNAPDLIAQALSIGIGGKITLTGLPAQAPTPTKGLFVEGWDEVIGENEWSMAWNTSPAEPWDVWQIGVAGHSEIGTTTRIGYALGLPGALAPLALLHGQAGPALPAAAAAVVLAVLGGPRVARWARRLRGLRVSDVPRS